MYESKAKITKITAVSRIALKDRRTESYYTVEYSEERTLPDTDDVDIDAERHSLWNDVNAVVDKQAEDIYSIIKNGK